LCNPGTVRSSRFPGKALVSIAGKTMLQHVWSGRRSALPDGPGDCDDDQRIRSAAEEFRASVRMTRADHPSGTDRAAEVASASNADLIVNIQGDEPLIDPAAIDCRGACLLEADERAYGHAQETHRIAERSTIRTSSRWSRIGPATRFTFRAR